MSKRKQQPIEYHEEVPDFLKMLSGGNKQNVSDGDDYEEKHTRNPFTDDDPQIVVLNEGDLTTDEVIRLKEKGFSFDPEQEASHKPHLQESQDEKEKRARKALEEYERETGKHIFRKTVIKEKVGQFGQHKSTNLLKNRFGNIRDSEEKDKEAQAKKSKTSKLSFEYDE
jgi:hypothetical protein